MKKTKSNCTKKFMQWIVKEHPDVSVSPRPYQLVWCEV